MSDAGSNDTERAQQAANRVESLVAQGRKRDADLALQEALRDSLPAMPLRFPLRLVRGNLDVARDLATALRAVGKQPRLRLVLTDTTPRYIVAWDKRGLGAVPARFAALLDSFGEDALMYEPRLHRISGMNAARDLVIAVELVRPEIRLCANCGERHSDPQLMCAKCRKERRKPKADAQIHEPSPDALQRAMERLADA